MTCVLHSAWAWGGARAKELCTDCSLYHKREVEESESCVSCACVVSERAIAGGLLGGSEDTPLDGTGTPLQKERGGAGIRSDGKK